MLIRGGHRLQSTVRASRRGRLVSRLVRSKEREEYFKDKKNLNIQQAASLISLATDACSTSLCSEQARKVSADWQIHASS